LSKSGLILMSAEAAFAYKEARALCTQTQARSKEVAVDFDTIELAIRDIEKQINGLDEIKTWSETIENNSNRILNRVRIMKNNLTTQVELLDHNVADLRTAISDNSVT